MEVMGGANYIQSEGATGGKIKYCTSASSASCLDFNYQGNNDYPDMSSGKKYPFYDELARLESTMHDVIDRGDSQWWHMDQPWNGDVWDTSPVDGLLTPATAPYIAFEDEHVSMSAGGWQDWVTKWVDQGPTISPAGVLDAMNQTLHGDFYHYDWCDRCEVFALHDSRTPGVKGPASVDGAKSITAHDRWQRWKACADGQVKFFGDPPPDKYANLDSTCTACPNLQFADYANNGGKCMPCAPGSVARGDKCEACPDGTVPSANNECTSCPDYQISQAGTCVQCPYGTGADRATNLCKECPADVSSSLLGVQLACGPFEREIKTPLADVPDDICKGQLWIEVSGLESVTAEQRSIDAWLLPEQVFSQQGVTQRDCPTIWAALSGYRFQPPSGPENNPLWPRFAINGSAGTWGACTDAQQCTADEQVCNWQTLITAPSDVIAASGNRVRFQALTAQNGSVLPNRLELRVSRSEDVRCTPK
jgi:hypothetical protein